MQATHPTMRQDKVCFSGLEYANRLQPFGDLGYVVSRLQQHAGYLSPLEGVVLRYKDCAFVHYNHAFLASHKECR